MAKRTTSLPLAPLLCSVAHAAEMLGISERAVAYLLARGELPRRKIARRTLIPVAAIAAFARADHPLALAGSSLSVQR